MQQLGDLAIGIVVLTVILVVVFLVLANLGANSTVAADSNATAAVNELTGAANDIPGWVPIVVIVVIGALLIGLIAVFRRQQ